jgi:hypothetical protein
MMWGNTTWDNMPCAEGYGGPGMMGGNWAWSDMPFGSTHRLGLSGAVQAQGNGTPQDMPCGQGYTVPDGENVLSLDDAESAVERYVEQLGYDDLHVTEVMEFERNYYAIVAEEDTGIGAMELLVDKTSGAVGPEHGPNMMWNAKYGMHRGGRMGMHRPEPGEGMWGNGSATGEMTVSATEAEAIAQQWLDANMPGRMAGEPDTFYGYYTLHFLQDGEIEGMLSVHGSSGDVWFHNWHGEFIAMTEHGHE